MQRRDWICSYADKVTFIPCHQPALWIIQRGDLMVGSCQLHKTAIKRDLTPEIHVWDVEFIKAQAAAPKAGSPPPAKSD